jgi:ornithine decarboxylase
VQRFVDEPAYESSIWGPTCDGLDCVCKKIMFPELQQGDWIYFNNMGAYTCAASSTFNGMQRPHVHYIISDSDW